MTNEEPPTTYVVAGTHQQFHSWLQENGEAHDLGKVREVSSARTLIGLGNVRMYVVYTGTYTERRDWPEIAHELSIRWALGNIAGEHHDRD